MKVGDLVTLRLPYEDEDKIWRFSKKMGLIIGGPRDGCAGSARVNAYEVMWRALGADNIGWHGEPNLEVLSECR